MVLTEARDLFLNDRETYCSDKTVKNYRNNLGYFFILFLIVFRRNLIRSPLRKLKSWILTSIQFI